MLIRKQDPKDLVREQAGKFDILSTVNEEEFDSTLDYLFAALLFGSSWEAPLLSDPKLRRKIPGIFEMPLICKAENCEYAAKCPLMRKMHSSDTVNLLGTDCRWEKQKAAEQFAAIAKGANLSTEETIEIYNAAEIVRLQIYKWRIDMRIAIMGSLMEKKVAGINNKTGQPYYNEEPTQLLKMSADLNKQVLALESQLMASRKDKMNFAKDTKQGQQDFKSYLLGHAHPEDLLDVPDAEFSEIENE